MTKENISRLLHKKIIAICVCVVAIALLGCTAYGVKIVSAQISAYNVAPLTSEDMEDVDFTKAKKLMIVAHPDDETLWGGAHLQEGGYLVVCITNGRNKTRSEEFRQVVENSGNQPLILNYPDKVNGERYNWKYVKDTIAEDLDTIINANDWDMIVTHNEDGEYGHIHHIMTHELVLEAYKRDKSKASLYFFGKYYRASDIAKMGDTLDTVSDDGLEFKGELAKIYKSQSSTVTKLWHMAPYENWTQYSEGNS